MADLVFGLAKSAVKETVNIARAAIEEEKNLKKSVQRNLMLISDELEMMHSFLNVAKDEHASDDMAKTSVRQVRDMALDVEDCIETVVQLGNKSRCWHYALPSCLPLPAPAATLQDAVDRIELLKARVEGMGQRSMRYNRIGDSNNHQPIRQMQLPAEADAATLGVLLEAREAAKKHHQMPDISDLIKSDSSSTALKVVSVWGVGGDLWTKSIIKDSYDHIITMDKSFEFFAWVKLMHPFNPHEFIQSLLAQFYRNYRLQEGGPVEVLQRMEAMLAAKEVLLKTFTDLVSDYKYLVVLEGVSTMVDWEVARVHLPDNKKGSCIIVHTQLLEIASLCVGDADSQRVLEMQKFSGHSVCAIYKEDKNDSEKTMMKAPSKLYRFDCVGRMRDLSILRNIVSTPNHEVVSVWGIAGIGKSFIVRKVYIEMESAERGFVKFGWVDVSHPFNIRDLIWRLVLDMDRNSSHKSPLVIKDPLKRYRRLLNFWRCLIVIDGLQSTEEWDLVEADLVPGLSKRNSCIVVITNEESVGTYCATGRDAVWNVRGLEFDESLQLFKQKVSDKVGSSDGLSDAVIEQAKPIWIEQAKPILHKCGGHPQVIIAIAESLAAQLKLSPEILYDWKRLNDGFMHELETNGLYRSLRPLISTVKSFIRSCPDILKPCIFYLSIFPVSHCIRTERLVRRWIAEGYARDSKEVTAEETATDILSKLVKRNIIQVLLSTARMVILQLKMPVCQVNGFIHEYIISRSMEDNLVYALEGRSSIISQRTGRHLAIYESWRRDQTVYETIDFSRLRSLTVFGDWKSFFISKEMRLLRVLDLEDSPGVTNADLKKIVKYLLRLKFLSLRGCGKITRLPDSIGRLSQLQTLDIKFTSITKLPKGVVELEKLQCIRACAKKPSVCKSHATQASCLSQYCEHHRPAGTLGGVLVPGEIGGLSSLHTLGVINVSGRKGKAILKELMNLSQVHKLGVSGINSKNSKYLLSFVSGHVHLKSLSVQLHKHNEGCLDVNLSSQFQPPENLQSLKLYGLEGNLPAWINCLPSLRKLSLQIDMVLPADLTALQNMTKLRILTLVAKTFPGGKFNFHGGLDDLIVLEICCHSHSNTVMFKHGALSQLEVLKIRCCDVSSLGFIGLDALSQLKEVQLSGSYKDNVTETLKEELEKHPKEIKPVLKVERGSS
ncbi:hypothetical protein EJB05_26739, partial [Eragrostis curvula]